MQHVFFEINEDGSEAATSAGRTNGFTASQEERLGEMCSVRALAFLHDSDLLFPSYCAVHCRKKREIGYISYFCLSAVAAE